MYALIDFIMGMILMIGGTMALLYICDRIEAYIDNKKEDK
jgi:hypothetical protein